jgi:hypothetical protein
MDNNVADDVEEIGLVVDVSCIDWMMRWIAACQENYI